LEQYLHVPLIKRNTRTIETTDAGKQIYERFKYQEKYLQSALDNVLSQNRGLCGTLRVSLPAALPQNIISPYLVKFLEQFPDVTLHITYSTLVVDLIKEGFDLVVCSSLPKGQNNLVRLLHKFHLQLYATPDYLHRHGAINTIQELQNHPSIMGLLGADGSAVTNYLVRNINTGEETFINFEPHLFINNSLHSLEIAEGGDIIVGGWDALMEPELRVGKLVKILPDYVFGEVPCYLVRHPGTPSCLELEFIRFIDECFVMLRK